LVHFTPFSIRLVRSWPIRSFLWLGLACCRTYANQP
jgi:hypothetical protein